MTAVAATSVLGWPGAGAQPAALDDLWDRITQRGWFHLREPRVVIQIGQAGRSQLVIDTARSLIGFLSAFLPECSVEVLDQEASDHEWPRMLRNLAAEETLWLSGIAAAEGVRVPRLWFESFSLITIAGACPHPAVGIACLLDAQANSLIPLHSGYGIETLAYEAHRLAASDLAIACGYAVAGNSASERWWAASANDVALDRTVAAAAGVAPARLPCLRELARHEVIPPEPDLVGELPPLRGYTPSRWRMQMNVLRNRVAATQQHVVHDVQMARRNVGKIPGFIRRRLAATRRTGT